MPCFFSVFREHNIAISQKIMTLSPVLQKFPTREAWADWKVTDYQKPCTCRAFILERIDALFHAMLNSLTIYTST